MSECDCVLGTTPKGIALQGVGYAFDRDWGRVDNVIMPAYRNAVKHADGFYDSIPEELTCFVDISAWDVASECLEDSNRDLRDYGGLLAWNMFQALGPGPTITHQHGPYTFPGNEGVSHFYGYKKLVQQLRKTVDEDKDTWVKFYAALAICELSIKTDTDLGSINLVRRSQVRDIFNEAKEDNPDHAKPADKYIEHFGLDKVE